jgi:hypothetical protein
MKPSSESLAEILTPGGFEHGLGRPHWKWVRPPAASATPSHADARSTTALVFASTQLAMPVSLIRR